MAPASKPFVEFLFLKVSLVVNKVVHNFDVSSVSLCFTVMSQNERRLAKIYVFIEIFLVVMAVVAKRNDLFEIRCIIHGQEWKLMLTNCYYKSRNVAGILVLYGCLKGKQFCSLQEVCKSIHPPGFEWHFTFTGQTNLRNLVDISYNRYLLLESKPEIQIDIKKFKGLPLPPFQNGKEQLHFPRKRWKNSITCLICI